jgi:D-alanine-D-alanine ligase
MDKVMTKRVWSSFGLPTPRSVTLDAAQQTRERLRTVPDELGLPLIVKAPHEGSSIGVVKVNGYSEVQGAVAEAMKYDRVALFEEFIAGDELTCPILGEQALPVIRIVAPEGKYDYQNKYFTDEVKYVVPCGLPRSEEQEVQRLALEAFRALGCRGWARADFMVRNSDRKPYLLEINTSPGMTSHSLVPKSAAAAGIGYEALCVQILALARLDGARH